MKSFQYQTTNKPRALAFVAKLVAAGYAHQKRKSTGRALPPLTFTTRTYLSCGPKPVYSLTWSYSRRAPLPPRRQFGRSTCSECGRRKVHTRKLCGACRFRQRYATDAEFRKRMQAKARKKMAALYRNPEWREKRAAYQARWAREKRARARAERLAA